MRRGGGERFLWLAVAGLLAFLALRLHKLESIALFVDEAIAIDWAADVQQGIHLKHASHGKLLLPYYLLPFQPRENAVFVARACIMLWTCTGFAAASAMARRYGGTLAGCLAMLFAAASPMLYFFDRMALSDTMLQGAAVVWIWSLLRAFDGSSPRFGRAWTSAALYAVAFFAKAPAALLLPLPLVAALSLPRWGMRDRLNIALAFYGACVALLLPVTLLLAWRGVDYFGHFSVRGSADMARLFDSGKFVDQLSSLLDMLAAYHGGAFMLCLALACLIAMRFKPRALLALLAGALGFAVALLWLGDIVSNRYYMPALALFFVAASIALAALCAAAGKYRNLAALLVLGLTALWILTVSLPFARLISADEAPPKAALPHGDYIEYVATESSGYGLRELAEYLASLAAGGDIAIEGAVANCRALRLYLVEYPSILAQCTDVVAGDRRAKYLNSHLPQQRASHENTLLALESPGYVERDELETVALVKLADFPRPGGRSVVSLYRVE